MRLIAISTSLAVAFGLSCTAQSIAAPEDCAAISSAYLKLVDVSYRQLVKIGDVEQGEFISSDNMLYAKVDGSWDKMPYPEKARRSNMSKVFDTFSIKECTKEADGKHNGKAMHVFTYIVPPIEGISTEPAASKIYISSDDGLPYLLTSESDTTRIEFSFDGVTAPVQ